MLTLAWVYRTGRDLLHARGQASSLTLLLSASVSLHLAYHDPRAQNFML